MKFLPIENIVYKTQLSENEIKKLIIDNIEPNKFRSSITKMFKILEPKMTKEYEGELKGQTFNMNRITIYRNSFKPRIIGTINGDNYGTTINVKLKLEGIVIAFLIFACCFLGFGFISSVTNLFEKSTAPTIAPLEMLLVIYVLTMVSFKYETNLTRKHLQKLFCAEIE
jgi:hypothetical protein